MYFKDIVGRNQSVKCGGCGVSTLFHNYFQDDGSSINTFTYPIPLFQCQSCGNIQPTTEFVHVHRWEHTDDKCVRCRGEVRRDKPLLCPRCQKPYLNT